MVKEYKTPLDIFNQQKAVLQPSGLSLFAPVMDFLGGAYQAYNANPQAGGTALAGAANAATKGMARGQARRQALAGAWKDYAGATDATIFNKALTGLDSTGYGGVIDANQAQAIQRVKQNAKMNEYLSGKPFQMDEYGYIDPSVLNGMLERRQGAVNMMNADAQAINQGQQASVAGQALGALNVLKPQTPVPAEPVLQNADGSFNASASAAAPVAPPLSPNFGQYADYLFPTDIPSNVAAQQRGGLEDAQKQAALAEAKRKAMATEALDKRELDLKQQGNYYKNYPPSGGSGRGMNDQELLMSLYGADGLRQAGYGLPAPKADPVMQRLQDEIGYAKSAFGEGSPQVKQAYQALRQYDARPYVMPQIQGRMDQTGQTARSGLSSKAQALSRNLYPGRR